MRSQIATSKRGRGGRRTQPYAFTEHGVVMLASVLKAPGAVAADIPLKITGTYVDPTVRPDVEALAKGQLKQKLQDVLKKNGLGGLFK